MKRWNEKVNLEDENLIEKTEEILSKKFNITINNNDKKFPLLYWTVKIHKNPPKTGLDCKNS